MKTILITGSTDGIGKEAAKLIASQGHLVLLHGRNAEKLVSVKQEFKDMGCKVESYLADLSNFDDVKDLAKQIRKNHQKLDVLINNAGVFKVPESSTKYGIDVRFVVNTIAPYILTNQLLDIMDESSRVINLSSAAQATIDLDTFSGAEIEHSDMDFYSQSKLAITMWSRDMADKLQNKGPVVIAVNPGSMLATNMVKQAFGVEGKDVGIGANILARAALDPDFADASGRYFDNDSGQFADPHPDALDNKKVDAVMQAINKFTQL